MKIGDTIYSTGSVQDAKNERYAKIQYSETQPLLCCMNGTTEMTPLWEYGPDISAIHSS